MSESESEPTVESYGGTYTFLHLNVDARASRDVLTRGRETDGDALSEDSACEDNKCDE